MREILFRGKDVINGEWHYGYYVRRFDDCIIHSGVLPNDYYIVKPETVGQYTGLTDKNRKKIFEDDICKTCICKSDMSEEDVVGMIYFRDGAFEFGFEYGDIYVSDILLDASEVIGNIHDNPELIKE